MLKTRIIPCLDVKDGRVVKGVKFVDLIDAGDPVEAAANSMPEAALDGWMRCLARLAAPDALLVMVHRADALGRVLAALGKRFGAAEVLPLQPREGRPATRIIVRARKGSRAPLILHAGLAVHEADGSFRPAVAAALRHGEALRWPTG